MLGLLGRERLLIKPLAVFDGSPDHFSQGVEDHELLTRRESDNRVRSRLDGLDQLAVQHEGFAIEALDFNH